MFKIPLPTKFTLQYRSRIIDSYSQALASLKTNLITHSPLRTTARSYFPSVHVRVIEYRTAEDTSSYLTVVLTQTVVRSVAHRFPHLHCIRRHIHLVTS